MYDKHFTVKRNFFFLSNFYFFVFWDQTKIIFFGRIYKLIKKKNILFPKINISKQKYVFYKNIWIKKKNKFFWKFFFYKTFNYFCKKINFRPINLYTQKGFWVKKNQLKKKKKIKTN